MRRSIGETQLCHRPIDSLDRRLQVAGEDEPLTLANTDLTGVDLEGCVRRQADSAGPCWPAADELRIALAYVHANTIMTWDRAAQRCGLPASVGERGCCRKLIRLGRKVNSRLAAMWQLPQAV